MAYNVQRGDTIAHVTNLMKMNWETLRRLNPDAVGRSSRNGNWFLKEGSVIKGKGEVSFESIFEKKKADKTPPPAKEAKAEDPPRWKEYTIKRGDTLWGLAVKKFHVHVEDLIRYNDIKDPKKIQPGQKIKVRINSYPEESVVKASWYGKYHHGRLMANGAPFDMNALTVAHRKLPLGTHVELENPRTGERVEAVVTDRGPYVESRDLDISYGLAKKLSMVKTGVESLVMRILG